MPVDAAGQQATVGTPGTNEKRYLAGSIHWRTGRVFLTEGRKKEGRGASLFLRHLDDLRRTFRHFKVVHVICDNAACHKPDRSHVVKDYLKEWGHRIVLHDLPTYSPDCNPVERVWWRLHEAVIPNDPVPGEQYYMLVFGSDTTPRVPRYTHTWATVVKTVETPGCATQIAEAHTISWMPATLKIHPWQFTPEPGRNLALDETIRSALDTHQQVAMWGPYEIHPRGYRRFLHQKEYIDSGRVGYQCIDSIGEGANGSGCDCIHAVTDMDPEFERGYYRLTRFGQAGSRFIVRQLFERDLLVSEQTHSRLNQPLGLCQYPIDHRTYREKPHLR